MNHHPDIVGYFLEHVGTKTNTALFLDCVVQWWRMSKTS
jgi:hypothetical protein